MKEVNYTIGGFCLAGALVNFMSGQYVMMGVTLFFAVACFKIGGIDE